MTTKHLIYVDRPEYSEKAIECSQKLSDSVLIAMNSMVMWQLKKAGHHFRIPYDYYDYNALFEVNEHLYERIETICRYMDERVIENVPFFKEKKFKPSRSLYYLIKLAVNTLCMQNLNIEKILEYEKPGKVYYFIPSKKKTVSKTIFCSEEMHSFPELMYANLRAKNIAFSVLRGVEGEPIQIRPKVNNDGMIVHSKIFLKKVLKRAYLSYEMSRNLFQKCNTDLTLLIYLNGYSVRIFSEEVRRRNLAKIIEFDTVKRKTPDLSALKEDIQQFWNSLSKDHHFEGLFSSGDVNLFPILDQYLGYLVRRYFLIAGEYMAKIESLLKKKRIDALLTPMLAFPDQWLCAKVCKHFGVDIITWQHGNYAMSKPHSQPAFADIRDADHWFAFGKGTQKAYEKAGKTWNTNIIAVGSCDLDKIKHNNQNPGRREIGNSKNRTRNVWW